MAWWLLQVCFFSLCMLVMRLIEAAFVTRAQEGNTQGAGDPGWHTTTDSFSIWSHIWNTGKKELKVWRVMWDETLSEWQTGLSTWVLGQQLNQTTVKKLSSRKDIAAWDNTITKDSGILCVLIIFYILSSGFQRNYYSVSHPAVGFTYGSNISKFHIETRSTILWNELSD